MTETALGLVKAESFQRTARARPTDGGTRVPANSQTLRPDKGRDYTERGGAHPAVTFDLIGAFLPISIAFRRKPESLPPSERSKSLSSV
jgi:hypothetical protein